MLVLSITLRPAVNGLAVTSLQLRLLAAQLTMDGPPKLLLTYLRGKTRQREYSWMQDRHIVGRENATITRSTTIII